MNRNKEVAMHPAALWKALPDGRVSCRLCSHFCRIAPGRRGLCGVRENREGALFTLVYDRVAAANLDPVEKKPLYHFLPGTTTFSFGTMGCNMSCAFCQNASLSQPPRQGKSIAGEAATPAQLVAAARRSGAASVSYTYSEPTVFYELMAETADLAHQAGLKNILVSNGFMSRNCLDALAGRIDAANIDLKAMREDFYTRICGAKLPPVLKNLVRIRKLGWWLEVTTLLIPGLNDSPDELRDLAGFLAQELGPDTPWHISRFHPDFAMRDRPPTPPRTLAQAWDIGREAGLRYVYVGNVQDSARSATYCPGCRERLIEREGMGLAAARTVDGRCGSCGLPIAGVGLP
jgi:pyruvate formate lyase activating enzyme